MTRQLPRHLLLLRHQMTATRQYKNGRVPLGRVRQARNSLLLVPMLLVGCATSAGYQAILQSWIGDNTDHLVSVWGAPQQEYPLRGGGRVLQYERSNTIVFPGGTKYEPVTTQSNGTVSGDVNGSYTGTATTYVPEKADPITFQQRCVTRFTADASGRIVQWAWEGNACRSIAPAKPTTPEQISTPVSKPVTTPTSQECTADKIRRGDCA